MSRLLGPTFALLVGTGTLLLGTGLLSTLLPLRGMAEGFSSLQLGLMASGYFLGFMAGTFASPRLLRRVGYARTFAFTGALLAASILLHALVVHPLVWTVIRIVTGFGLVLFYALIESWLNDQCTPANRGRIMAIYTLVCLISLAVSQQLLLLGNPLQETLFIVAALCVCLSLLPVTLTRLTQPLVPDRVQVNFVPIFRAAPVAGGIFLQIPIGKFSDRYDRRRVLFWVAAGIVASAALMTALGLLGSGTQIALTVAVFFYGGFAFTLYPVAMAHLVDNIDKGDILSACASILVIFGFCAVIGPILAGTLIDQIGLWALPLYLALVHLLLMITAGYLIRLHPDLLAPSAQTGQFVPLVRTTPAVMELHPNQDASLADDLEDRAIP